MRRMRYALALAGSLSLLTAPTLANDWAQFRGPQRSGISSETAWNANWNARAPKPLWMAEVGESYASTLVAEGYVYFTGSTPEKDSVYCLNAETGKEVWTASFDHPSRKEMAVADPRSNALTSTPLLHEGRLYVVTREGELFCLESRKGDLLWRKNLLKETGAKMPYFGVSSSPVVEKSLLVFNLGTGGVAVQLKDGKVAWKSSGMGGYASPVLYTRNGKREVALFGTNAIIGVEAETGKEAWRYPWKEREYSAPSADPVWLGDSLLVHSEKDGAHRLKLDAATPTLLWRNQNLASDFTNSILYQGHLYGNCRNRLTCMDAKTGAMKWQERGLGTGSLIIAGGKLIAQTERGELIVAEANPTKYVELGRMKLFEGKDFSTSAGFIAPTLANGRLYCRVSSGKLVCLDVRGD